MSKIDVALPAVLDAYGWPHNLSDNQILARLVVKRPAAAAGIEPEKFAGHSLRAGLATAAAAAGVSERSIMSQTGTEEPSHGPIRVKSSLRAGAQHRPSRLPGI
jgi:hypothetical protein